ncbi:Na+/H+ antiporter [Anaerocolumna jejuensis]|uniref:Na+/H+ antiporter n=1 Tax=Anaerocolumna jejuensis TaxID=259063 RepID=UPI003F7B8EC4
MELFYGVLLMLGAILLSNLINRFVPAFSIPIIQIILGIVLSLFPTVYHFTLDPELFLILFLAPLLFHDGMQADKISLWNLKKPIIMLALGLVFFTVVVVGVLINFMVPAIPLAAAFALAAALAPTDAVAVSSIGKRIKIPEGIKNLLEGEALINDASGIVSFQFAVAAMVTGTFSLLHAGVRFLYVAVGGVIIGIIMTALKYLLVKWIRSLGMENVTFHLLLGILTPFIIYMAAEECRVSGILAVVISGVIHSFEGKKLNPETAILNVASKSIWSTLTFVLNGLVFLILGMQLPVIIKTIWYDSKFSNLITIGYILVITAAMMLIRFLWSFFTVDGNSKVYEIRGEAVQVSGLKAEEGLGRARASLIISMAGVRGSVTLASTLALPFVLGSGKSFPERNLIIFIAAGVILCSLLIANFILPLLLKKESTEEVSSEEREACLEIIQNVIRQLNELETEENRFNIGRLTRNLALRAEEIRNKNYKKTSLKEEQKLRREVLSWEIEYTRSLLENHEVDEVIASKYLDILDGIIRKNERKRFLFHPNINKILRSLRIMKKRQFRPYGFHDRKMQIEKTQLEKMQMEKMQMDRMQMERVRHLSSEYVLKLLYERKEKEDTFAVNKLIAEYESLKALLISRSLLSENMQRGGNEVEPFNENSNEIKDLVPLSFQIERDEIQAMYERGRISWETAQKMRSDIAMMELQLKKG